MSKELEALKDLKECIITLVEDYGTYGSNREEIYNSSVLEEERKLINVLKNALKEKEQQDGVIQILKEIIEFSQVLPHIEPSEDNGFHIMSAVGINIQRDIENKERELLRKWILETCFPKELKALEIIKELAKSYYVAFCDNDQTMNFRIILRDKAIWEEIRFKNKEKYDLLKEVLL